MMLVRMQRHGHRPIAIAGGGTGLIGDPGGKSMERPLLTRESLQTNLEGIRAQLARFLDFDAQDNAALLINNADWLEKISSIDFMRDVGKHFSVNYMLRQGVGPEPAGRWDHVHRVQLHAVAGLRLHDLYSTATAAFSRWGEATSGAILPPASI